MSAPHSLISVPLEILEHIAFFSSFRSSSNPVSGYPLDPILGPPSSLVPLLLTCRHVYDCLKFSKNHHLYARIFAAKFDIVLARRRLRDLVDMLPTAAASNIEGLTAQALASELKHRCIVLKRIRGKIDSTTRARHADLESSSVTSTVSGFSLSPHPQHQLTIRDVLATAYFIALEDVTGRNRAQLLLYAGMKDWLREFWFHPSGSSLSVYSLRIGRWPPNKDETAFGMWLFWILLESDDYDFNDGPESPQSILKALALAAHHYNLTNTSWMSYHPHSSLESFLHALLPSSTPQAYSSTAAAHPSSTILYGQSIPLRPPPLGAPAILAYLTLSNKRRGVPVLPSEVVDSVESLLFPTTPETSDMESEFECEWGRCLSDAATDSLRGKAKIEKCFKPGSIEGVWEGFFTYIEFTTYATLLSGGPPNTIQKTAVGKHQQTWKLREHHLRGSPLTKLEEQQSNTACVNHLNSDRADCAHLGETNETAVDPLRPGDPLRSYFPLGTQIRETTDGLVVTETTAEPGPFGHIGGAIGTGGRTRAARTLKYQRFRSGSKVGEQKGDFDAPGELKDIILTGEGHSAWGQFNLVGRIRPCDGFISLSKDYTDGDRGKWLYRGYLIGNDKGNLSGRWRDTLSPADVSGYEGCFVMSRRR